MFERLKKIFRKKRKTRELPQMFTREQLVKLYLEDKLSCNQIAKKEGCNRRTVWTYLNKYNIPLRNRSECQKVRIKKVRT